MLDFLPPEITDAIITLIGAVLLYLAQQVNAQMKKRAGIELSARQIALIHSAAMTGVGRALGRGLTPDQAVQAGIDHMLGSGAGDTVRALGMPVDTLRTIAEGKLGQIMMGKTK